MVKKPKLKDSPDHLNQFNREYDEERNHKEKGLKKADVLVDGIFGFSFKGEIRPPFDEIVKMIKVY